LGIVRDIDRKTKNITGKDKKYCFNEV